MKISLKLRKVSSSFMIATSSQVIRDLRLKIGDNMLLDIKDSNLIIRKEVRQFLWWFSDAKEVPQPQPQAVRNDKLKALGKRDDNNRKMITSGQ